MRNLTDPSAFVRRLAACLPVRDKPRPLVVGVTGSVAAGKTVFAAALAQALRSGEGSLVVEVVSSDGFLYPNAVLEPLGRTYFKGFPDTYDTAAFVEFLRTIRQGEPATAPVHSHEIYDIVADGQRVDTADVVIVEGLHLLGSEASAAGVSIASLLDECIYIDAPTAELRRWFVERFMAMRAAAVDDPTSFYATFAAMTEDDALASAAFVWDEINGVNLAQHIEPSRRRATVLVTKAADHSITSVTWTSAASS